MVRYEKGLSNRYVIAGLPRTNNGLESHFGALRRRYSRSLSGTTNVT